MPTTDDLKTRLERNTKAGRAILVLLKKIEVMDQSNVIDLRSANTTLEQIRKALANLPLEDQTIMDLHEWVKSRMLKLDTDKKEFADKFSSELASLLKTDGFDLTGQYPELKVKFYTISSPSSAARAWAYGPALTTVRALLGIIAAATLLNDLEDPGRHGLLRDYLKMIPLC